VSVKNLVRLALLVSVCVIAPASFGQKIYTDIEKLNDPRLPIELITHYVIPKGSPFDLRGKPTPVDGVVAFHGTGQVDGEFIAKWLREEDMDAKIAIEFIPSIASRTILPYVEDTMVREVNAISFWNQELAIKALLTKSEYLRLRNRRVKSVSGNARIEISGYSTGVDCDHRWYQAKFVKVVVKRPAPTAPVGTFPCGS
jgi:hypothetical protein